MAVTIKWKDNSSVEKGHRIYKSSTYFTSENLPAPLVDLGPDIEEYEDTASNIGENWYILSAYILGYELFSEPFIPGLDTTNSFDIFGDGSAVATYQFNGDATDLGGGYDATIYGNVSYNTYYATVPIDSSINIPSMTSTGISIFFRNTNYQLNSSKNLFLLEYRTGDRIYTSKTNAGVYILDGVFSNVYVDNVYLNSPADFSVPDDGLWHHLYAEYPQTGESLYLGAESDVGSRSFEGDFYMVRIFNRSLTSSEVNVLYQEINVI